MARKRALERWGTKLANCEITPKKIWPIAKSLSKSCGSKVPSAFQGPLGPILYPIDRINIIADCLEDQFRGHDLYDCDHRRHMESKVKALLVFVDEDVLVNF
jgi:hypothetical protein